MHTQSELFRDYLNDYFLTTKTKNPSFSLRSFAKKLKMNPGGLSLLLNGKRKFTDKAIDKICDEMCLSPTERKRIFTPYDNQVQSEILEQSMFESISNWVHDAFLTLIKTKDFKNDPNWICRRLNVSPTELSKVIQNLLNLGLVKIENGQYVAENSGTEVYVDSSTTTALKKLQLDANILSRLALENEPVQKRYHGTNTLAIDPEKMEEAKQAIREFRQKFCVNSNWNGRRARVYQLNVSFYPIDQEA